MPSPFHFSSPLPPEDLRFLSMTATEGLSVLGAIELQLVSARADISADELLGQPAGVTALLRDGAERHFNGIVTRFGIGAPQGRYFGYHASIRPWLWVLTRTADCRIFQDMSVPEIVDKVFADHGGLADHSMKLFRSYRKRSYCVQYRESDYNFIARLLEEEGIYWYYEHGPGTHRLVLTDDNGALQPFPGCESLPHFDNQGDSAPDTDCVSGWTCAHEVRTGKVALTSYDFERPSASLRAASSLVRGHSLADHEQFDFQGEYTQQGDGVQLTENRIDELQSRQAVLSGSTNAVGLAAGHAFALRGHPRDDQNDDYLCVQTSLTAQVDGHESSGADGSFHCSFTAMPMAQQFRPARRTPKPFVQGPQTAVVVGPGGEEIYTDKYGRVKVQFHWDRYGGKNEKSSCWVRVSSPWAGQSFGFMQVPRIGQEVVVDFLEGDPDQPIITGRVYNAEQMPPWELPANMTQSGLLTRSTKGGAYGNANALRFEDKKGAEQLWLHAEKDQLTEVEHDEDKWVGNDRRKTIDRDETNHIKRDRTETVDRNEKITVHGWRTEEVDLDETITIHKNRTEQVDLNESISIGVNRSEDVGANETISIGANRSITIGSNKSEVIGGSKTETIAIAKAESIGAAKVLSIGAGYAVTVGGAMNTTVGLAQFEQIGLTKSTRVGGSYSVKVGEHYVLEAEKSITLRTGDAEIVLQSNGDISIKGSGNIVVKGSKISEN